MTIESLVDFPAIQQLARALWRRDPSRRGAAVLVGAGFSLNAELAGRDTIRPPLWSDLERDMESQLYPGGPPEYVGPLRLAEEYRAYHGQSALDEFIRIRIRDEAWRPGHLHKLLLELPWSDVLTTNWDTLLERAAQTVSVQAYEVVRTCTDLAHARAPRIVKLHGSIGTSERFIIAEDDYRTYPTRYAAFVNVARQVFIENELCLLGFSGDDPNFLQWSGWVRDELGGSARRIYLVGVLGLGPAKRKLLEARNVAPIDLSPLVKDHDRDQQDAIATRLFLDFLAKEKPAPAHDWRPSKGIIRKTQEDFERCRTDHAYVASLLDRAATAWITDRNSYPNWLICPRDRRYKLRSETDPIFFQPNEEQLSRLSVERRAEVLYELSWRCATALLPLSNHLISALTTIADPAHSSSIGRQKQLEIAVLLLKTARFRGDDQSIERWSNVIEAHADSDMDLRAEVAYQRCLRARDQLDYANMVRKSELMREGRDPVWRLRLAALLCMRGEFEEANILIKMALKELQDRQLEDRTSLWVKSRLGWAQWLASAARRGLLQPGVEDEWPLEFRRVQCDPWEEIEGIERQVWDELRTSREANVALTPEFEPGTYRDASRAVRFTSPALATSGETIDLLADVVGIPVSYEHVNLIKAVITDTAELDFNIDAPSLSWYLRLLRAVNYYDDPLLKRHFGRVRVARMPPDIASKLAERTREAIAFWRKRIKKADAELQGYDRFAVDRLGLFIEVLSRLTTRQDADTAAASFSLAMDLACDSNLGHYSLYEPIGHLAHHSARAIPPDRRSPLGIMIIELPLASEMAAQKIPRWPNYEEWLTFIKPIKATRLEDDDRWARRVKELIEAAQPGKPGRPEAASRLSYLANLDLLTDDERAAFANALWSDKDEGEPPLPAGTDLLPHVFSILPAPADMDPRITVRQRLFGSTWPVASLYLYSVIGGAHDPFSLLPSRDQALRMFEQMTAWRPKDENSIASAFLKPETDRIRSLLGKALTYSVLPVLTAADRTDERGRATLALIEEAQVKSAISSLPYFLVTGNNSTSRPLIQRIRRGLIARSSDETVAASAAIESWVKLAKENEAPRLPNSIVEHVVAALEMRRDRGIHALLWCARRLAEDDLLSADDKQRLQPVLGDLMVGLDYNRVDLEGPEAITVSLSRAECVRLAQALRLSGSNAPEVLAWIDAAKDDPLPEVRFALLE